MSWACVPRVRGRSEAGARRRARRRVPQTLARAPIGRALSSAAIKIRIALAPFVICQPIHDPPQPAATGSRANWFRTFPRKVAPLLAQRICFQMRTWRIVHLEDKEAGLSVLPGP